MKDLRLKVNDGRELAYSEIGDPQWPCVFFFHGAPSSRLRPAYLERRFVEARIRVISPDRPGYGGSSPQPGRTMANWPEDVRRLVDELGIDRLITAGHSSGGPYALICAGALKSRVAAAVTLGGVTDMAWAHAWEGFLASEAELMRLPDLETVIAACRDRYGPTGTGFFSASGIELSEPDQRLYADEETSRLLAMARAEAFRQGIVGYAQDVFIQGQPWPFEPGAITIPVHLLHGEADTMLPLAHSRHNSQIFPNASLHILPGQGHLSILSELPGLASDLARKLL